MFVGVATDAAPPVDKTVVVSLFDSVHETPWLHRPHHYYDAGYSLINTVRIPLLALLADLVVDCRICFCTGLESSVPSGWRGARICSRSQ